MLFQANDMLPDHFPTHVASGGSSNKGSAGAMASLRIPLYIILDVLYQ